MATKKFTRANGCRFPQDTLDQAHDEASVIERRLFEEISALRCVYRVVNEAEDTMAPNDDLSAARNLLNRLVENFEQLHNRVDLLSGSLSRQVRRKAPAKGAAVEARP